MITDYKESKPQVFKQWERCGQAKIALKVPTEVEMVCPLLPVPSALLWMNHLEHPPVSCQLIAFLPMSGPRLCPYQAPELQISGSLWHCEDNTSCIRWQPHACRCRKKQSCRGLPSELTRVFDHCGFRQRRHLFWDLTKRCMILPFAHISAKPQQEL